ncbi:MAG: vitamin B12 dependent-methionine synthase activation domain-containing protein [Bacteroidota bacterium]|nr:vitamin B12 dependent-methionine synthase activation domain-containing protein [Bacteroidota bacterium]
MKPSVPMSRTIRTMYLEFGELALRMERIENALGYPLRSAPPVVSAGIADVLRECEPRVEAACGYVLLQPGRTRMGERSIEVEGVSLSTGGTIAACLRGVDRLAVFVATAGWKFHEWFERLSREPDPLRYVIADAVGSEIAERAAEIVEETLRTDAALLGMQVTSRYSPGYCGWPLSDQRLLFSLLPPVFCGVTLTETVFMVPEKSVSGVIGIGERVERKVYDCGSCPDVLCDRRWKRPGAP